MVEAIFVKGTEKKKEIINIISSCNSERNDFILGQDNINFEESTYHVVVYENQKAVATGSLITTPEYYIENVSVLEDFRKKYFGDLVIKMLLDKGFNLGAKEIFIHAPKELVTFFKKIGFYELEEINEKWIKLGIQIKNLKKCKH